MNASLGQNVLHMYIFIMFTNTKSAKLASKIKINIAAATENVIILFFQTYSITFAYRGYKFEHIKWNISIIHTIKFLMYMQSIQF